MNLLSFTPFVRELSPGSLHALFFVVLTILAILWVIFSLKRGDRLFPTLGIAAGVGTLFYLTSPVATDAARWWIAGGIAVFGLIFLWTCRDRVWKPLLIATGVVIVLVGVLLTSTSVNLLSFENSLDNGLAFYFLCALAWLVIQVVIPRTRGKQQAVQAAGLTVVLSIIMLIVALVWWREAVDGYSLPDSPIVATGSDLAKIRFAGEVQGPSGIFVVGMIGDSRRPREYGSDVLARYTGRVPGASGRRDHQLPPQFELSLADGTVVTIGGITSPRQAYGWPEGGRSRRQHVLRHGDPVVIWAEPGTETAPLGLTRVIAYGSLETFQNDFLSDLIKTSRGISWIAILCMCVSAIPLSFGLRHLRHRGTLN